MEVDVAFKCFLIKSSSLIIDFIGAIVLVDLIVLVIGVVDRTSGAFVSSSALTCNKSSMKLVKFDEIFLKPGTVVAAVVLVCCCSTSLGNV